MASIVFNEAALAEVLRGPAGPVGRDLARRALRVETAAKQYAPVDTGRLRSSITHQIGSDGLGLFALIGSNVEYAIFQELGTRYMSPHAYLVPALAAAA